jgi:hypothetical protein
MAIEVDDNSDNKNDNKLPGHEGSGTVPAPVDPAPQPGKPAPTFEAPRSNAGATGKSFETGNKNSNNSTSNNNTSQQPPQGNRTMISARQNYGMSRAATSQAMRAIVEVIDKISEGEQDQPVKFTFSALDGEKEGLLISALVVAATLKNAQTNEKFVAHHTLLLAATARGANAVEQSFGNGIKYERLVVAADAYDAVMRARINEVIGAQFPGYQMIDADATVVPADLDLRSEEAVRNVIANATTAASTLLASVIAQDGWVINAEVLQQTFQNEIKSSYAHFADLTGQPVRGDVVLEMSMLTGKNQNQQNSGEFQYNTSQAKRLITQITGYIDLISTPQIPQNAFGFGANAGLVSKAEEMKIFTPRLVITNVDTEEAAELPVILQGLATTQALYNDGRWVGALIAQHKNGAQHAEGGVNIRDLSAIGLEAPQMVPPGYMGGELPKAQRLPLTSAVAGDAMLGAAVQTYFHQDLLISMDVPECGASSWITSPFAAAARGDQNAIRDIFEAADLLTGGKFTPIYKANNGGQMKAPIYNDNMYVNLGFYNSAQGKRDIRDGDYLAVLNATGDSELETINDWANLQANAEVDPMFRLTETRRIQQNLFNEMTITGRAVRITFNPAFIYSLAAAVFEAGLVYETKVGMAAPQGTTRMVPSYMRNLPTNLGNVGGFVAAGMSRNKTTGGTGFGSFGRYANNNNQSNAQSGTGNF